MELPNSGDELRLRQPVAPASYGMSLKSKALTETGFNIRVRHNIELRHNVKFKAGVTLERHCTDFLFHLFF